MKPLYTCRNKKGLFSIQQEVCDHETSTQPSPFRLKTCFSSLFFGSQTSFLSSGTSEREHIFSIFKKSILKRFNLLKQPTTKTEFVIAVQKKNPEWKDSIVNTRNITRYLEKRKSQIFDVLSNGYGKIMKDNFGYNYETVKIQMLELEDMSVFEQVKYFSQEVDLYITTQIRRPHMEVARLL